MSEGFPGGNGAPEYKGGLDEGDEVIGNTAENLRNRRLAGEAFNAFTASELDTLIADYDKEIEELEGKINEIEAERAQLERDIAATKAAESAETVNGRVNRDKAKENSGLKKFFSKKLPKSVTAIVLAITMLVGTATMHHAMSSAGNNERGGTINNTRNFVGSPDDDPATPGDTGEKAEELYIPYDYSEYDSPDKSSPNAYGESQNDSYENEEATKKAIMKKCNQGPEYTASYISLLDDEQLEILGLSDMSVNEIDDYFSEDTSNPERAAKYQKLLEMMEQNLNDKENTRYSFYIENGTEKSMYTVWQDDNGDGIKTPDEMHLGWCDVIRHGAPQVDIERRNPETGEWEKRLDLNYYCGLQPNIETPPPDMTYIPNEETPPETPPKTQLEKDASQQIANAGSRAEYQTSTEASATSYAKNIYQTEINRQSVDTQKDKDILAKQEEAKEAERQARSEAEAAKAEKKTQEADEEAKAAQEANDAKVKEEAKAREETEKRDREAYEAAEAAKKAAEEEEERIRAEREADAETQELASQAAEAEADELADLFNQLFGEGSENNNP